MKLPWMRFSKKKEEVEIKPISPPYWRLVDKQTGPHGNETRRISAIIEDLNPDLVAKMLGPWYDSPYRGKGPTYSSETHHGDRKNNLSNDYDG